MLKILLHSSKTMRPPLPMDSPYQQPALLTKARELAAYVATLSPAELQKSMQLSANKAAQTHTLLESWTANETVQRPAIDAFLGDIYSGLQVKSFDEADRAYANDHLLILSGLYGGLRALDSIHPYRLEMGYKFAKPEYSNLYRFWGSAIADLLSPDDDIINLSAVEYTRAVLPHIKNNVITPKFMTISPKTGQPTFVTVHAKIARGAFANWLIKNRINDVADLVTFNELGYRYSREESQSGQPAFICSTFGGLGLSVRLQG